MPKDYKEIIKASGKIQDFYADFSTRRNPDDSSFLEDKNTYKTFMNLLFPDTPTGIYEGKAVWDAIKKLATGTNSQDNTNLKKLIAEKIRVYYFDGNLSNTDDQVTKELLEFYGEVSARPAPAPAAKPPGKPKAASSPQPPTPAASAVGTGARPSAYTAYDKENYVTIKDGLKSLLRKCVQSPGEKKLPALTMILVDTPDIDLKLRNCDTVSTFLNYTPGIIAAQMIPYLDVTFSLERKSTQKAAETNVMSPLKFLLGSEDVKASTPNQFLYDSYTVQRLKDNIKLTNNSEQFLQNLIQNTEQENASAKTNSNKKTRKVPQQADASQLQVESSGVIDKITITGMEMFTMPQTLINMDYDQLNTPRYNPVLNSTVPFGTILSFKIDLTSAGLGFSHKTGILTLKIFDRSRLVEIADFLNPRLYSRATLWITYGWRAPQQFRGDADNNDYFSMINQSMLKKEAYGISNSSVSMSDDGTCTVSLNLFMKFANELSTISETVGSAAFNSTLEVQREKMSELRDIAKRLGLQSFGGTGAGDVRGEILIKSALEAKIPSLDSKGLETELKAIDEALKDNKNPDAERFRQLVSELYSSAGGSDKSKTMASLDAAAKIASSDRFKILKETHDLDLWAVVNISDKTNSKFEPNNDPSYVHPLSKLYPTLGVTDKNGQPLDQGPFGRFGSISFARLFAVYFSSAMTFTSDSSSIDEYQIIFYNFNDYAGHVSNMNIGEFPIDVDLLRKHYEQEIVKQKGENFTLVQFLEIVRTSQFGNIRHKAFGFSDLFDDKEGKIKKDKDDEFVKKQFYNQGLGASFTLPAIDFHIETSTSLESGNSEDLLVTYQAGATMLASTLNGSSRPAGYKKILRIHIYDKASMAHKEAYDIMRSNNGMFVEVESSWKKRYRRNQNKIINELKKGDVTANAQSATPPPQETPGKPKKKGPPQPPQRTTLTLEDYEKAQTSILSPETDPKGKKFGYRVQTFERINASSAEPNVGSAVQTELVTKALDFGSGDPKMTFDRVKREISKFVPTIVYGSNGTLVKSINYGSEQDAALATIMMLRNKTDDENVTNVNGSSKGDLPLRVISGQLSITTLGCPLLEYMQQYFVDLGTGTTIDNIYSITGLSHNFSPGSFTSDIKFTFADAYGTYEGAQSMEAQLKMMADRIKSQALNQSKSGQKQAGGGKVKK